LLLSWRHCLSDFWIWVRVVEDTDFVAVMGEWMDAYVKSRA
jgi:hypothetical protein